jgi:threonine/homoserine/homoserine lactone efflux protein
VELSYLFEGFLIGLLVSLPVGPVGINIVHKTLSRGRRVGFTAALGAMTADLILSLIAVAGITFIVSFIEEKVVIFRILGGVFVIFIGIRIFREDPVSAYESPGEDVGIGFVDDYLTTMLMVLSNPTTLLAYIAIFAGINFPPGMRFMEGPGVTILGLITAASAWWFSLTYYLDKFRSRVRLRFIFWFQRLAGILIILFGVSIIITLLIPNLKI